MTFTVAVGLDELFAAGPIAAGSDWQGKAGMVTERQVEHGLLGCAVSITWDGLLLQIARSWSEWVAVAVGVFGRFSYLVAEFCCEAY